MYRTIRTIEAAAIALAICTWTPTWAQTTWYVDDNCPGPNYVGTLADPFCSIQDGIDVAAGGDTVLVFPGTYNETVDFVGKGITLQSLDGPDATAIDGIGLNDSVVKCISGEGADTVVDGFTITRGIGTVDDLGNHRGGGMYIESSAPTIVRCHFTENETPAGGPGPNGGAGIWIQDSSPMVKDCLFTHNTAADPGTEPGHGHGSGGGIACHGDSEPQPRVIACMFENNHAEGSGGAMINWESGPYVANCHFLGNSSGKSGGAICMSNFSYGTLLNCVFAGNVSGQNGGAILNKNASPTLINCTICVNVAIEDGGGMHTRLSESNPTVVNTIFWGNLDTSGTTEVAQLFLFQATLTVDYSCVQGWTGGLGGNGNTGDYPFLVRLPSDGEDGWGDDPNTPFDESANDDYGNLRLLGGLPCTDAADTSVLLAGLVDLDGNPRVLDDPCTDDTGISTTLLGSTVDMGAYEFCLPGDLDIDGDVDLSDLAELLAHYGITCPQWEYYDGHHYRLTDPGTWDEAEQEAVAAGGHLVTVDDPNENQWLYDTFSAYGSPGDGWWIGLYQLPGSPEPAEGWVWISGDTVEFLGWYGQEPNNLGGGEDWAHLELDNPPQWNDLRQTDPPALPGIIELP